MIYKDSCVDMRKKTQPKFCSEKGIVIFFYKDLDLPPIRIHLFKVKVKIQTTKIEHPPPLNETLLYATLVKKQRQKNTKQTTL